MSKQTKQPAPELIGFDAPLPYMEGVTYAIFRKGKRTYRRKIKEGSKIWERYKKTNPNT